MILKQRFDNLSGRPLTDLANDVESIFEHVFGDGNCAAKEWCPCANVVETDAAYRVELELPGVAPADVSVELKDGVLSLTGQKNAEPGVEGSRVLKAERRTGSFGRTFKFTTQLDADKISAQFKQGILTVVLPKSEKVLPRKIEVKIAD